MSPSTETLKARYQNISDNLRIKCKHLVWLLDAKGLSLASIDKVAAAISACEAYLGKADFRPLYSGRAGGRRNLASQRHGRTGAKLSAASIRSCFKVFDGVK